MKKIFEKHETLISILLIVLYVVINSYCMQNFGLEDYRSTILFKMMAKDNVKSAIIVSSVTFGIGHAVNLLNGADLIPTLTQMCYAIALGYLFVTIFYRSKSLVPCIITHILINSFSIFNVAKEGSIYRTVILLMVVPLVYAIYINKTVKE